MKDRKYNKFINFLKKEDVLKKFEFNFKHFVINRINGDTILDLCNIREPSEYFDCAFIAKNTEEGEKFCNFSCFFSY